MTEPIVVRRHIAAPPSSVYSYLTEAEKWIRWQGVGASLDPRQGGAFSVAMPNGATAQGELLELVPNLRVVFSWGWQDHPEVPPGSSIVEIDLTPVGAGTLLILTHRGLPEGEVPIHAAGWNRYVPRLAAVAQGEVVDRDRAVIDDENLMVTEDSEPGTTGL